MRKKQGNGEGSIRKRHDGRWEGRLVVEVNGRTVRRSTYGRSREEVAKQLRNLLKSRDEGGLVLTSRLTVGAYLADWLVGAKAHLREATWRTYERHLRLHALPTIGRVRLHQLRAVQLQAMYQSLMDGGLSLTTVRHVHSVLTKALGQAVRWDLLPRNPASLVSAPRRARHRIRTLDLGQARALLRAAQGDRLEALYVLALTTGMRQGELLALRWRDVDVELGTVAVTGTLHRSPGRGFDIAEPKTSRSRRRLQLSTVAIDALRQHRARQAAEILAALEWDGGLDLVFPNRSGRPIEASNLVRREFRPTLKRASLPPIRFHDLRHTAATLLLSRGVHPKIASEMLGHATVAFTLDAYSHVTATMQQEAADTMNSLLGAQL